MGTLGELGYSITVTDTAVHVAQVTEWYPGGQHPARSGVYEIEGEMMTVFTEQRAQRRITFRYFDGERWYFGGETPALAMRAFQTLGIILTDCPRWRGLTKEAHDNATAALLSSAV